VIYGDEIHSAYCQLRQRDEERNATHHPSAGLAIQQNAVMVAERPPAARHSLAREAVSLAGLIGRFRASPAEGAPSVRAA